MTYCRNCGANLEPGATKCRRCGAEVTDLPEEEPSFSLKAKEKLGKIRSCIGKDQSWLCKFRSSKLFWPLITAAAVLLIIICISAVLASCLNTSPEPAASENAEVVLAAPSPSVMPSLEPTREPEVPWADIYKGFLETEPAVNSAVVQNAAKYGFEGIVTAELYSLADVNGDGVPELLLSPRPESLPGWNVTSELGYAVESYIVCEIKDDRVSPLMCVKPDYSFFPLTFSINDHWLLALSQGEGASRSMEFLSPQSQSSCRSLRHEFAIEQRCNSTGNFCQTPVDYYYSDDSNISSHEYMEQLFPDGAEALTYFPIYFRPLTPGCLDTLEEDWENRELQTLSREELSRFWNISGAGQIRKEANDALPYISEAYCLSISYDQQSSVITIGIDSDWGWEYVRSIEVLSVKVDGADAWIHSSITEDLPEGQVFQYVVGVSFTEDAVQNYTLSSQIKLSLYDGSETTLSFETQAPSSDTDSAPAEEETAAAEAAQ